jgi:hypothetical protein
VVSHLWPMLWFIKCFGVFKSKILLVCAKHWLYHCLFRKNAQNKYYSRWCSTINWERKIMSKLLHTMKWVARWYRYFQTKNPYLGKFRRVIQWKCWYIGIFYGHLVHIYILWIFVFFVGHLEYFSRVWYVVSRKIWRP